jgi:hypothetical protein
MKRLFNFTAAVLSLALAAAPPLMAQQDNSHHDAKPGHDRSRDGKDEKQPAREQPSKGQQDHSLQNRRDHPQARATYPRRQVEQSQQREVWQNRRARSWGTQHRDWQQRGGYRGYRIPETRFRAGFGREHSFRIYNQPMIIVGSYPRFQYQGYWFTVMDRWPESWSEDWYQNDDMYIEYSNNGYYLHNHNYPDMRLALYVHLR